MKGKSLFHGLLISAVLLTALITMVDMDWQAGLEGVAGISGWTLLAMWASYQCNLYMRAWRLRLLLRSSVGQVRAWSVVMVYQWFTSTLPFRSGEISLLPMLKQYGVAMAHSLAVVVVFKWAELVALLINFIVVWIVFQEWIPFVGEEMWWSILALILGSGLGVVVLFAYRQQGMAWLEERFLRKYSQSSWLKDRLEIFQTALMEERVDSLVGVVLVSLLARPFNTLTWLVFFGDLAPLVPWQTVVVGEMLFLLASQLPIHGLLGVGSFHALFVVIFSALGLSASDGMLLATGLHFINLLTNALTGLQGTLLGKWLDGQD
ncbi:MAG: hypothetical protein G8345_18520 [Magnetococcales bacterium]|nr:flippase-like domain-containing protein [Magnetococcales bacterium]NGZ28869.1 hypothetical protein [Magnetococcales bacterium]